MATEQIIFAGVEFSSGRKPLTFAGLDKELNIKILEKWDSSDILSGLEGYEEVSLAINIPTSKSSQASYTNFNKKLTQAGFSPISKKSVSRQWLETNAQDCFQALSGHNVLPRRTLEGRLQRCAILYEQGLLLTDPVDMLEEITRYKLIQGILPLEKLPSINELDALVAAYLAWISVNRPGQMVQRGGLALPASE